MTDSKTRLGVINPVFTLHSALRLMERGITRDHIVAAVLFGQVVDREDGKDVYALDRLRVVVARDRHMVITAYRTRRMNEKQRIRKARQERRRQRRMWGKV